MRPAIVVAGLGNFILIPLVLFFVILSACHVGAREQYAMETGKDCTTCHVSPSGGKQLTDEGKEFLKTLSDKPEFKPAGTGRKYLQFVAGYLHVVFAFLWFGTILYVHIVLKPAYAIGGLPKGELLIGWLGIIITGTTGFYLAWNRIGSTSELVATKFGILLSIKVLLYLFMLFTGSMATFVIGPRLKKRSAGKVLAGKGDLTVDELAGYDGQEGRPAYVGFEGKIYDVTNSRLWNRGAHVKRHKAGYDLTSMIAQAPHGSDKMVAMPVVGSILSEEKNGSTPHKGFFLLAYLSLVNVMLILLIISLWKWW
jgi:predicted heme/steroid binding protein